VAAEESRRSAGRGRRGGGGGDSREGESRDGDRMEGKREGLGFVTWGGVYCKSAMRGFFYKNDRILEFLLK
jgi:hypothetical protein